jgi:mRNA-degrading endonuclease HigB of HigAB toxin-antitoxin module
MVEKFNGNVPFRRKDHGSERRGVFPVPSVDAVGYQLEQSKQAKARLIERMKAQHKRIEAEPEPQGLGNRELPAFKHKTEIIERIEQNRATILGGETGSGKSTQVPQFLYEAGYDKIFVLVPRRVIADGLGDRIREELVAQLGESVATHVGINHGERVDTHDDNRIVVMTPDTYNGMAYELVAKYKDKKVVIMSDEIHEANLFTEIATGVAAMSVLDNDKWRLIAASATHNTDTLLRPFAKINGDGEVPIVNIEGRPFEVELREQPDQTPMQVYASFDDEPEKTMIFTSGKREIDYIIDQTTSELEKREFGASLKIVFRKLHGELTEFELSHIDDPIPEGHRLVIVSSPAGMSGITIPGVTRVITDGTINRSELDDDGVSGLARRYLSKAGITQQIGRAGRDVPGGIGILSKPITIEEDRLRAQKREIENPHMPYVPFDERVSHEPAEIYHSNLGRVVLRVAALDRRFGDINEFIPHRVAQSAIIGAEESLFRLGALDEDDKVTPIGRDMNRFVVSPELSRGIVEARRNGRPIQHLAHIALIAAAIDNGGIQDFADRSSNWKKFIRPTTGDDFVAQLDLMMAIGDTEKEYDGESERYFFYDHDLHPKKIERARKSARKILRILGVDSNNLVLRIPNSSDEALIRSDFTAGMIDLVYEETRRVHRKVYYKNIHGDSESTERLISGRSIAKSKKGSVVAGIPRWYEKRDRSGTPRRYDIVEQILSVSREDVGRYAEQNGLLVGRPLRSFVDGDMVVEQKQQMFGSIAVGKPIISKQQEYIPETTQKVLIESALKHPGKAQLALRAIAEELERYHQTIPSAELETYKKSSSPDEITKKTIEDLVRKFAKSTRSLSALDRRLAEELYSRGASINRYFDDEARVAFQARSPEEFEIAGHMTRVFYDMGTPYVTQLTREQRTKLHKPIYLPDEREIKLQVIRDGKKFRVSVGTA